jgi:anti-sigma-K factor RskA
MMSGDAVRNPGQNGESGDIEALLPWYAAGTLRRRDRQRVEEALREDAELARLPSWSAKSSSRPFISTKRWARCGRMSPTG